MTNVYKSFRDITCVCGNKEIYIFKDSTDNYRITNPVPGIIDKVNWCYVCNRDIIALCCKRCNTYFFGCHDCSDHRYFERTINDISEDLKITLCQFIGYDAIITKDYCGTADIKTHWDNEDNSDYDESDPEKLVFLDFRSKNQYYANLSNQDMTQEHGLTGPDGGYCHSWKCTTCNTKYSLTDK